jgi:hypothetical protein
MLFDLSLQLHASTFILNACIRNPIINKLCSALRSVNSIIFFSSCMFYCPIIGRGIQACVVKAPGFRVNRRANLENPPYWEKSFEYIYTFEWDLEFLFKSAYLIQVISEEIGTNFENFDS